jgi:hypothetical protein
MAGALFEQPPARPTPLGGADVAEVSDVVRARRIEVVDDEGRVRVVIGLLGQGDSPIFGLVVQDESGHGRGWVQHDGAAAEVGLDFGGNTVAALNVSDSGRPRLFMDYTAIS